MIRPPQRRLKVTAEVAEEAQSLIDRSGIVALLTRWIDDDRRAKTDAAVRHRHGAPAYPIRSCLVGLYLLVLTKQPLSWTALLQLFWVQLSEEDLRKIGLADVVTPERQTMFLNTPSPWPRNVADAWTSEYKRLTQSLDVLFDPIRWSPHVRKKKQTNAALAKHASAVGAKAQQVLNERKNRQDQLINDVVAASVDRDLLHKYPGDIMFDEVVVQTGKALINNTGPSQRKKHCGNPEAGWWQKANGTPLWGVGAHFLMAGRRPDGPRIPTVVIGISITKPNGGALTETLIALDHAQRTGLARPGRDPKAPRARSRLAIADRGYTYKDGMNEALLERGYYLMQEFQANVHRKHELPGGAVLFNGVVICPGFEAATRTDFDWVAEGATPDEQAKHAVREKTLLAGRMLPNGRPTVAVRGRRGRPKKGEQPLKGLRLEVTWPASSGRARCPHVPESMTLPVDDVSTVVSPPDKGRLAMNGGKETNLVCNTHHSSILLPTPAVKHYGIHLVGSDNHKRLYKHFRAINEQWHSLLRARHTGGIDGNVFSTLGAERIALFIAMAVASTNSVLQETHRRKYPASQDQDESSAA